MLNRTIQNRHVYGKNGVLIIDNVREHIERNDFPRIPIGSIAGFDGWFIEIVIAVDGQNRILIPALCYYGDDQISIRMSLYCNLIRKKEGAGNTSWSYSWSFPPQDAYPLNSIETDFLLNDENGCLNDNGELSIEYGIHVKSFQGIDGIWKFNVFEKTFGKMGDKISLMERDGEWKFLHYHRQMVQLQPNSLWIQATFRDMSICFQIAHGVRIQILNPETFINIIMAAQDLSLPNVIRYCEQKLIEKDLGTEWIKYAIDRKLDYHLAQLIRNLKSSKELKDILEDVDIQKMSGEAMKQCAKFFYKNSK